MNYYLDLPHYVSNSQLGDLKKAWHLIPERSLDLQAIFDFGNLVDAATTEPEKLNFERMQLSEESGNRIITFPKPTWDKGIAMGEAIKQNPVFAALAPTSIGQYVFLRRSMEFNYHGNVVVMPTKCKFDLFNKIHKTAIDIKTTSCSTQKAFIDSMKTFSYFRQAAFYMDMARIDKMWYLGVSKVKDRYNKYPVFQFAIARGDANYEAGKAEYNRLGFLYYYTIYKLQLPQIIHIN